MSAFTWAWIGWSTFWIILGVVTLAMDWDDGWDANTGPVGSEFCFAFAILGPASWFLLGFIAAVMILALPFIGLYRSVRYLYLRKR